MPALSELVTIHQPGYEIPPTRPLWTRNQPLSPEEAEKEVDRLLTNPLDATFVTSLSLEDLTSMFPRIFTGHYIGERRPPSEETKALLQFFGTGGDFSLFARAQKLYQSIFASEPHTILVRGEPFSRELVTGSLNLMARIHGKKTRRTGELAISHEVRTGLRVLTEALSYDESARESRTSYVDNPYSPLSYANLGHFGYFLSAVNMHDVEEDYVSKGHVILERVRKYALCVFQEGHSPVLLSFPDKETTDNFCHLLSAFTNKEAGTKLVTEFELAQINLGRLLMVYANAKETDASTRWIFPWVIVTGKTADREDNVCTLWSHTDEKYLDKLVETIIFFQSLAKEAWNKKHEIRIVTFKEREIIDSPLATSTALLKLLGASDEELFGWIMPTCSELLEQLESEGQEPIVVPNPFRADILTSEEHIVVQRGGQVSRHPLKPLVNLTRR